MYFLYLDESGVTTGSHFVVAGFAIFERQTFYMAQKLDDIQKKYFPDATEVMHFHATSIRSGSRPWDAISKEERYRLLDEIYDAITTSDITIFGDALEKGEKDAWDYQEAYQRAFTNIAGRFDLFLGRKDREGDKQRGLIILAESRYQEHLSMIAPAVFWQSAGWRTLKYIADIPYFAPAKRSRMLQAADFISNAIYGYFEGYSRHFNNISSKFDKDEQGIMHGFKHFRGPNMNCGCVSCYTRGITH